ncbi:MAG: rhodanese-like domain-containing protein [Pirellulales bacterium]|nr:rhodanese-like domain-containing protein [Pirellulales bacterium]
MSDRQEELPLETSCGEVSQRQTRSEDFLLLDCREADERELVHIDGSGFIPMSELQQRVDELAEHKDRQIVIYCHHGGRSLQVTRWLRQQGYHAQSMAGGIDAWAEEIDTSLQKY